MTLDELLALLPDNTTGEISAADFRTIVTELYNRDEEQNGRLTALESSAGEIAFSGIWQYNPQVGSVPQAMQVSLNASPITQATWARFWFTDLNNKDMRNFLLTASKIYVQQESDGANWAYYNVTGAATDLGNYIEVPIEVSSAYGSSMASQWQRVLAVITMPSAAVETE